MDKRLRLNVGSILCKSFARIKEGTPMPDIIKQIVDEEIELPGYPLQVSIQYSYMFLRNVGPVQKKITQSSKCFYRKLKCQTKNWELFAYKIVGI